MNRHMRRAAIAKSKADPGRDLAGIAEKLQPYLAQIEGLQSQLQSTAQLLRAIQDENRMLRLAVSEQREVFMRMFAAGMGVTLDTVLSMETEIQDALATPHSDTEVPQDSAASTQD